MSAPLRDGGHSAGGQAAQRFALADTKTAARAEAGVHTRYIPCNPGHYSNLNPGRFCNPAVIPVGIKNDDGVGTNDVLVTAEQMAIQNYGWYSDPIAQLSDLLVETVPDLASECAGYDLGGGYRGFSTDDATDLYRSFENAAENIPHIGPEDGPFPRLVYWFAAHYFEKDVWHLQSRLDQISYLTSCVRAMMGSTRPHCWWSLREGLLRWELDFEPPALKRFYSPDTQGPVSTPEHDAATIYPTDCVRVALDIIDEAGSDIAQYHNNTWFT